MKKNDTSPNIFKCRIFFFFFNKKNLVENIYEFFDGCVELYEDYRTFIW